MNDDLYDKRGLDRALDVTINPKYWAGGEGGMTEELLSHKSTRHKRIHFFSMKCILPNHEQLSSRLPEHHGLLPENMFFYKYENY